MRGLPDDDGDNVILLLAVVLREVRADCEFVSWEEELFETLGDSDDDEEKELLEDPRGEREDELEKEELRDASADCEGDFEAAELLENEAEDEPDFDPDGDAVGVLETRPESEFDGDTVGLDDDEVDKVKVIEPVALADLLDSTVADEVCDAEIVGPPDCDAKTVDDDCNDSVADDETHKLLISLLEYVGEVEEYADGDGSSERLMLASVEKDVDTVTVCESEDEDDVERNAERLIDTEDDPEELVAPLLDGSSEKDGDTDVLVVNAPVSVAKVLGLES